MTIVQTAGVNSWRRERLIVRIRAYLFAAIPLQAALGDAAAAAAAAEKSVGYKRGLPTDGGLEFHAHIHRRQYREHVNALSGGPVEVEHVLSIIDVQDARFENQLHGLELKCF